MIYSLEDPLYWQFLIYEEPPYEYMCKNPRYKQMINRNNAMTFVGD